MSLLFIYGRFDPGDFSIHLDRTSGPSLNQKRITRLESFALPPFGNGVFLMRMSTIPRMLLLAMFTSVPSASNFVAAGIDLAGGRDNSLDSAFRLVREAVEKGEVPGAIALVARGGSILRQEAHGLRDIER